jgi:hypothetical protein
LQKHCKIIDIDGPCKIIIIDGTCKIINIDGTCKIINTDGPSNLYEKRSLRTYAKQIYFLLKKAAFLAVKKN